MRSPSDSSPGQQCLPLRCASRIAYPAIPQRGVSVGRRVQASRLLWPAARWWGLLFRRRASVSVCLPVCLPAHLPGRLPIHLRVLSLLGEEKGGQQLAIPLPAEHQEQGQQQEVEHGPEQVPRKKGQGG